MPRGPWHVTEDVPRHCAWGGLLLQRDICVSCALTGSILGILVHACAVQRKELHFCEHNCFFVCPRVCVLVFGQCFRDRDEDTDGR
eukprot:13444980-Alexandrium_andersonii.AAC.1